MRGYITLSALLVMITLLLFSGVAEAQQFLGVNLCGSSVLVTQQNSDDIGSELQITYRNNFIHINKGLYLFGRVTAFYQPKTFKGHLIYATDAPHYDRYRYGGAIDMGFYIHGPILNAEFGAGLSRDLVHLNRTAVGLPPPSTVPFTPAPQIITRSYTLFGVTFALSHEMIRSLLLRMSVGIHASVGRENAGQFFRPGIGLAYKF